MHVVSMTTTKKWKNNNLINSANQYWVVQDLKTARTCLCLAKLGLAPSDAPFLFDQTNLYSCMQVRVKSHIIARR